MDEHDIPTVWAAKQLQKLIVGNTERNTKVILQVFISQQNKNSKQSQNSY